MFPEDSRATYQIAQDKGIQRVCNGRWYNRQPAGRPMITRFRERTHRRDEAASPIACSLAIAFILERSSTRQIQEPEVS